MPEAHSPSPTGSPPPALVRALRRMLGPLVRLLLEYQITFPVLTNLLKSVYVEQATRGFAIPGRPQTISRISLLTGIHRKDVKRLQDEPPEMDAAPASVSLGAQLVLRWTADPEYQTPEGQPMSLPRLAGNVSQPSFETLVESVSKDIRPRAVLDEWQRLGIASVDENDHVRLATNAFVPKHGFDEKAYFLGRNIHDHLATTGHNIIGGGRPMLERSVYYAKLSPGSVDTLQELSTRIGMDALQEINRRARTLQLSDVDKPDANQRMSFGIYFYHAPLTHEVDESAGGSSNAQPGDADDVEEQKSHGDADAD